MNESDMEEMVKTRNKEQGTKPIIRENDYFGRCLFFATTPNLKHEHATSYPDVKQHYNKTRLKSA